MKKYIICLITNLVVIPVSLLAQEAPQDSANYGWKKEVIGTLNLTQASFDNWQQGGESTLAWQINFSTDFTLDQKNYNWSNIGNFALGFAKIEGEDARKSADEINLESVYTRKVSKYLNPFVAATARTQFVSGFEFTDTTKVKISEFLDPGYFTQSAGVGYAPSDIFKTRLGAMIKETVTDIFPQESQVEGGLSSVSTYKNNLAENILFKSKLDLFSNLKAFNQIDMIWENDLTLKVSKLINVTVEVDVLYDKDISDDRQIKQTMAVGLTYTFL